MTFMDLDTQIRELSKTITVFKNFQGLEFNKKHPRTFKDV